MLDVSFHCIFFTWVSPSLVLYKLRSADLWREFEECHREVLVANPVYTYGIYILCAHSEHPSMDLFLLHRRTCCEGVLSLWFQKTLTAVLMRTNTFASMDFSDHWCTGSQTFDTGAV